MNGTTPEQPYLKVLVPLRRKIELGSLPVGEKLKSISDLASEYEVAPSTARRALAKLQDEGLAEPRHGVGWFVTDPPPAGPSLEERVAALEAEVRQLRGLIS